MILPDIRPYCRGFKIAGQIKRKKIKALTALVRTN